MTYQEILENARIDEPLHLHEKLVQAKARAAASGHYH